MAPMSQAPSRGVSSWSVAEQAASLPASIAGLPGSNGKRPCPGAPSSMKAPRPGSPVRSLAKRLIPQLLKSPIMLLPSDVIGPEQSQLIGRRLKWLRLSATMVFCSSERPRLSPIRKDSVGDATHASTGIIGYCTVDDLQNSIPHVQDNSATITDITSYRGIRDGHIRLR